MNKLLFALLSLSLISVNCFAASLNNFSAIKSAVLNGKTIRIVIDFKQCSGDAKASVPKTVGAFSPNEIQVADDLLASSLMHFTMNDPSVPNVPVYEFGRYVLTSDNNLTFTNQALHAQTYQPVTDKATFICKLNTGVMVYQQ